MIYKSGVQLNLPVYQQGTNSSNQQADAGERQKRQDDEDENDSPDDFKRPRHDSSIG